MRSGRNASMIATGRVLAAVLSAAFLAIAARQLSLADFNDLAIVLALGSVLFFMVDAGFTVLLAGHVAEVGAVQWPAVSDAIVRRVVGSCVALAVLVPAYLVSANDTTVLVPLIFWASLVGNSVHGTYSAALRSVGRVAPEVVNEVASRLVVLVLGAVLLWQGAGLLGAVTAYAVGDVASAIVLTPLVRRHVLAHPAPSAPLPDLSVRRAAPIAFGAGLTTMYGRVDTWLVALVGMPNAAALYGASYRVMEAIMIPADAIGAVALTEGVRATESERGKVARRFSAAAVGLTLVPGLVLCAFAPLVLRVVFGPTFEQAAGTLRLLLVSAIIGAAAAAIGPLAALVGGRRYPVVVGAVLVLNVGANLVLVPAIGMQGAAWANVVSESALAALFGGLLVGRRQGRSNT